MDHGLNDKNISIADPDHAGLPLALAFSRHLKTIVSDVKFFEKKFSKTIRHSAPLQSDYRSCKRTLPDIRKDGAFHKRCA